MKGEKEKWIEDVLTSMEGSQRALPSDSLFDRIESKVSENTQGKIIPLSLIRVAAAAIILLIAMNFLAMKHFRSVNTKSSEGAGVYSNLLISDFNIYE